MKTIKNCLLAFLMVHASIWGACTICITFSGTVRSDSSTGPAIAGAKVVGSISSSSDSTTTNGSGQYSLNLQSLDCCNTYTFKFSAPNHKDSLGNTVKTIVTTPGSGTVLNTNLFTATSSITGHMQTAVLAKKDLTTGATFSGFYKAKLFLQHQATTTDSWVSLDSVIPDTNANNPAYTFSQLIAASGGSKGSYRLMDTLLGVSKNSNCYTSPMTSPAFTVGIGAVKNYDMGVYCGSSIFPFGASRSAGFNFTILGNKLILNLRPAAATRTLNIVDLDGTVRLSVKVSAGDSKIELPAFYAPDMGYVYDLK